MTASTGAPVARRPIQREPISSSAFGIVEKPLSTWERITNVGAVRKTALLVLLAIIWEAYARMLNNPLLFPTFAATVDACAPQSSWHYSRSSRSGCWPWRRWS